MAHFPEFQPKNLILDVICRVADMTWDSKSKCWIPTEEVWDSGGIPWDSDQRDSKVTGRIPLGFWKTVGIPVGFRGITTKGIPK